MKRSDLIRRSFAMPLAALLALGLLAGCGSEVADDWSPAVPQEADHPFAQIADHGDWLSDNGYPLDDCLACHALTGDDSGDPGDVPFGPSCGQASGCHDTNEGPEACNTCHGDFDAADPAQPASWAPDDQGHTAHLDNMRSELFYTFDCSACHRIPRVWDDRTHIDEETPGEVEIDFHEPANAGAWQPEYDRENGTCSAVYCHQGGELTWGDNLDPLTCTSCHAIPPPAPHPDATEGECVNCHSQVVDEDGEIINPELHMNGRLDGPG